MTGFAGVQVFAGSVESASMSGMWLDATEPFDSMEDMLESLLWHWIGAFLDAHGDSLQVYPCKHCKTCTCGGATPEVLFDDAIDGLRVYVNEVVFSTVDGASSLKFPDWFWEHPYGGDEELAWGLWDGPYDGRYLIVYELDRAFEARLKMGRWLDLQTRVIEISGMESL